jgi:hypothetical protein
LQDPHPRLEQDSLVRGMDPRVQIRIRIHTKMAWIRNTGPNLSAYVVLDFYSAKKLVVAAGKPKLADFVFGCGTIFPESRLSCTFFGEHYV